MSPVQAACPACGAPVNFKVGSSVVTVCDYCKSVVARGDRAFEDLGKVADIVETGSPLDLGLRGVYRNVAFELTGRAQLAHSAGGMWDEWYAAFADGRWGWLAEAQGRFYLTFQMDLFEQSLIAPFESLELGEPVPALPGNFSLVVAEKGEARTMGASGEIPYRLVPGETYRFADLSGSAGEFATLDYGEEKPLVFVGREVTLAELGIAETVAAPEREARRVAGLQLSCPQCGGALDLRAPDKTERVTCPNCGSLLDVGEGKLRFLAALEPKVKPIIPIGSEGDFEGARLTIIGFMQRSVEFSGVRYYWEEYLLYNPGHGFRWLVRSDDHWSFVQAVPPGEVSTSGRNVRFRGKRYKLFQDATARVEHVIGEFYWKVTVGELVRAADYIHPPQMLSKEISMALPTLFGKPEPEEQPKGGRRKKREKPAAVETGEINWSFSVYVERSDLEKTFGIKGLPKASTVAPNQPFPHKTIYKYWLILLAAAFVFGLLVLATGSYRKVFEQTFQVEPMAEAERPQVVFSEPIELRSRQNIRVSANANVNNSWLFIDGDFINEETGLVQQFAIPVEYYQGVEGGESWSEGDRAPDVFVSALPAGKYTMRLEVSWQDWKSPAVFSVSVVQGVPRILHLLLALLGVSVIPLLVAIRHFAFEKRRWQDSDYSPYESS